MDPKEQDYVKNFKKQTIKEFINNWAEEKKNLKYWLLREQRRTFVAITDW